ncbi:hypothetical protein [Hymenobacter baengnokdamensis]|uniref:hypothetical protein n=1 Tax=Hymenobacter baengnokdamensis TaxID=2615203 RepID=UPI001245DE71|nr:hypothetical protein [Hymenobacter baengnokdamensis]
MLPARLANSLLLSYPACWLLAWPATSQTPAKAAPAASQLGKGLRPRPEARPTPPTLAEELTRELAGWSVPQAAIVEANKLGAHWLW